MKQDFFHQAGKAFLRLLNIVDELREKCPWDKEQTMQSIRHLTIEEVHELSEAILQENTTEIKKELGDILLHVLFYAKIASETNAFNLIDVIEHLCHKLIRRHPHIYGEIKAETSNLVKQNWEQIKQNEQDKKISVLQGVPSGLPALIKAYRMQEKAASVGFDWDNALQVWQKVQEELNELNQAVQNQNRVQIQEEFGDLLFSLVNYARFIGINPDDALEQTNKKFKSRFEYIEQQAQIQGKNLSDMSLSEMNAYWHQAKEINKKDE
ncbi:MAG: nucleoside triphosphate pyrophosphohydrolase [Bacteroidia bacterium]|nr:nucleoside triphosphate pyrophosphohydrolase [Bacteroidia bacterium]MDW8347381.1 nucleoside triphosphate pyrophosphohydrolase [Bacteroidia bacterium]